MPLQKPWRDLERETIAAAPDRPGVYELGDASGTVLAVDHGVLRDELKSVLAYGDGDRVRWTEATRSSRPANSPTSTASASSEELRLPAESLDVGRLAVVTPRLVFRRVRLLVEEEPAGLALVPGSVVAFGLDYHGRGWNTNDKRRFSGDCSETERRQGGSIVTNLGFRDSRLGRVSRSCIPTR